VSGGVGVHPILYFFNCATIYEFSAKMEFEDKIEQNKKKCEKGNK
jgi:hypothetical protein